LDAQAQAHADCFWALADRAWEGLPLEIGVEVQFVM
jgi:hypothetical protein|tara:strand:- start:270 stop:377 length:108 start_codon:yes stop_codon:yes gene_type:complete